MQKITLLLVIFIFFAPLISAFCGDNICDEDISSCLEDCFPLIEPDLALYGRVIDNFQNPVENESVFIEWVDKSGLKHSVSASTINAEKAFHLGDEKLVGYYFLSKDQLSLKNFTVITIKTQARYQKIETQFITSAPNPAPDLVISKLGLEITEKQVLSSFINNHLKKAKLILIKIIAVFLIILLVIIFFIFVYRKMQNREVKEKEQDMTTLLHEKLERIMSLTPVTISKNQSIFDALEKMVENRINSIIVVEEKLPVGIVTEDNFLRKVYLNGEYSRLKIRDIMSWPLVTAPNSITLAKAVKLLIDNKIRKLPLVHKENLVGIVTITDILKVLNSHPGKDDYSTIPIIQDILKRSLVSIEKTAKISEVIKLMIEKNSSYVLVYDETRKNGQSQPLGIITTKDLLYEFYKNSDSLKTLSAIHMMKSPIETIKPSMDIFEANTHMLYMNFRRMPVQAHQDITGILTQIDLLKEIYTFLREKSMKK